MLGSLILYLKGMRIMMFQLSGFYYNPNKYILFPGGFLNSVVLESSPGTAWSGGRCFTTGGVTQEDSSDSV